MSDGPVTLFTQTQFQGSNVTVGEGETRFGAVIGFNDVISSVRVAPGFVVMLFEHANEFGGFGRWVDLMEDCADLSVLGLDKQTSYVRVFPAEQDNFVWARNASREGQVFLGHWERKRANGETANSSTAIVAPPAPPPTRPSPSSGGSGGIVIRDHEGGSVVLPAPPRGPVPPDAVIRDHRRSEIKHVFVLMLENRSFDHMLGFSGITGTDASTGLPTSIDGLTGNESNAFNGVVHRVVRGAPDRARHDPGHGFDDVCEQLCGPGARFVKGLRYPPINNSGFVANYAKSHPDQPDQPMHCFTPEQVPVITALAREFLVCDRWFSSMPGPTEPNRWFAHAATAGEFDESPSSSELAESMLLPNGGFAFDRGTIYDRLRRAGIKYRFYACDHFPNVAELKGVSRTFDIDEFDEDFASDVSSPNYDAGYTFIEPSYDAVASDFGDGNSQHPLGSVRAGELLIKKTYEALRRSPIWKHSMLIVTYDEHGGFYDHVPPPIATATGSTGRRFGFRFDRLGVRVPAIVVSPLIPRNQISHHHFEHSSIASTLTDLFNLDLLTTRAASSSGLKHLATLKVAREDAPMRLPNPASGPTGLVATAAFAPVRLDAPLSAAPAGGVAATLRSALAQHFELTPQSEHAAILARVKALQTRAQALQYLNEVVALVDAARARAGVRSRRRSG